MGALDGVLGLVGRLEVRLRDQGVDPAAEQDVRVVAAFHRAAAEGDVATLHSLLSDDARFEIYGAEGIPRAHARGREATLEGARLNFAALEIEPASVEVERIGAESGSVVVLARMRVRWGPRGTLRDERCILHFQLRAGRLVCFRARVFPAPP
jgi:ketosteroid isomerase-like protein